MSRTKYNANYLWNAQDEVDELWNEEKHHCLAEVCKYPNNSKSHASAIAESISHKHIRRKAVVLKQRQSAE